ncbi:FAD-binding protein [Beijerinckia mobilis]|uniref:FAD-binding protein n=1 Tax=Beijerinckia mobilis TaxID=231434 RepID=UPI00055154F2|nr:FAD-binding protein [Beijerinckia mobilis]
MLDAVRPSGKAKEVDLLVFGAGAAGMTAALIAALDGLDVLLCEKTSQAGGITATSGGTIWIPGTSLSVKAGVPDKVEEAARYLDSVVGARGGAELRAAFLESGPKTVDDLDARTEVKLVPAKAHPDYIGNHPGEAYGGRALSPEPFDGRLLGKDFDRVRPPRDVFLVLGGMMVARTEIAPLLNPFGSLANFRTIMQLLTRQFTDRLRYKRGTRLVMGNALVARLLYSLRKADVPIRFDTSLVDLLREDGVVVGAVIKGPHGLESITARKGVVLATGGIAQNKILREKLFPASACAFSLAPASNSGDGVAIAEQAGAALAEGLDSPGLWMPCSRLRGKNGTEKLWPHIILDRAKPGLIAVNKSGRRFVNESDSYHDFVMGMLRANETTPSVPAYLICDRSFIQDYGIGLVFAGTRRLAPFIKAGYLMEGKTLRELAGKIGADAETFERTVADHNRYAKSGVDEEFGRGTSKMNCFNGDPENKPNPCMRPIEKGPFYAVAVWPADLATSAGLRGNADGQVLDADGSPIQGLYACGNDMSSIFRGTYPGPGTTLGPALVFGWRVAKHAAHQSVTNITKESCHATL